jgi:hypothetical protein
VKPWPGYARALALWQGSSSRDRRLAGVLALALVLGLEALAVWPVRTKRLGVQAATTAEQQAVQDGESQRQSARAARLDALQQQLDVIDAELAQLGAVSGRPEPLSALVQRSVAAQGLALRGLRALPVESLHIEASAASTAASAPAATPAEAAAPLYRHRVELQISGPTLPLIRSLDRLAQEMLPLRVERVHLAGQGSGQVQATLTLATIGTERTWLEL